MDEDLSKNIKHSLSNHHKRLEDSYDIEITFFMPCYNEENNVIDAIKNIESAAKKTDCSYEIIIFDDKSTDNSIKVINEFMNNNNELPIILIEKEFRRGVAYNYIDGAIIGKGKYYRLFGAKNTEDHNSLIKTIKQREKAELIIPYIEIDMRNYSRRFISILFTLLVNLFNGKSIKYYNGPVLHHRVNVIRWHSGRDGYAYQAMIITRMLFNGATFIQVPIIALDRSSGKSNAFDLLNIITVVHCLIEIFLLRVRYFLFK